MKIMDFGNMNEHAIGMLLKTFVNRAMVAIRNEKFSFEKKQKVGYTGQLDDVQTSADRAAQEIYTRNIRECFPTFGVIAEEDELKIPCTHKSADVYWTVDPLDGTRAFIRKQSHGVGTMISLVYDNEVISAAVGDINTREIFYYRPGSPNVWRVIIEGSEERCYRLEPNACKPLCEQYVLLRDNPGDLSAPAQRLIRSKSQGGIFKNLTVTDGSIGISMARLWKGEVAGHLLSAPQKETPWDATPVMGISEKLGFVTVEIDSKSGNLNVSEYTPVKEIVDKERERLVIHRGYLPQLGLA